MDLCVERERRLQAFYLHLIRSGTLLQVDEGACEALSPLQHPETSDGRSETNSRSAARVGLMSDMPLRHPSPTMANGFTLIELMIVVSIVGILAAIAVPQYQLYTGKAQIGEAIHISAGMKAAIAEQISVGSPFSVMNGGTGGIPDDVTSGAGQYVDSLRVVAGEIVARMRSNGVSPCVVGATVRLTPQAPARVGDPVIWVCSTTAACKPETCG